MSTEETEDLRYQNFFRDEPVTKDPCGKCDGWGVYLAFLRPFFPNYGWVRCEACRTTGRQYVSAPKDPTA